MPICKSYIPICKSSHICLWCFRRGHIYTGSSSIFSFWSHSQVFYMYTRYIKYLNMVFHKCFHLPKSVSSVSLLIRHLPSTQVYLWHPVSRKKEVKIWSFLQRILQNFWSWGIQFQPSPYAKRRCIIACFQRNNNIYNYSSGDCHTFYICPKALECFTSD